MSRYTVSVVVPLLIELDVYTDGPANAGDIFDAIESLEVISACVAAAKKLKRERTGDMIAAGWDDAVIEQVHDDENVMEAAFDRAEAER